ncbi:FAD-binding oxidoreductase [Salinibacterium sp. dk2585]|uniref:FAD-binding oxidoreductase n=1 Tax=unclassified Salinibacterium TaxID=2632331 RepID=UPI0011C24DA5|nr:MULTISPECIES: FAD-binding oxidoreductase [unclassified Salinibacterium]QEE60451.1 FAD-binding oxidoreductase [Salinibacterium sp. dk2585]TXK55524.1 FAD-binding oxidoreductase [Salinibacterium sp. dk5596]
MPTRFDPDEVAALATSLAGPVLLPGDADYGIETRGQNLAYAHTPEIVVGAANPDDVVNAVRFAAQHDLPVRMLATGHGSHSAVTDGMIITTRRLRGVSVEADAHTATVGAGVTWGEVQQAAASLGLSTVPGAAPTVGVVGYLLGGGLGPLARSHGFSSDHVRAMHVVTASGELVHASALENQELFWALRGGKGGLGIVTTVELSLVELATLYGGSLFFDAADIATVLRGWVAWARNAPAAVTTSVAIVNMPPLDAVPRPLRGRTVMALRFAYPGDGAEGEKFAAPLAALATPLMGELGVLPAAQIGRIHDDPQEPMPAWSDGLLLDEIDDDFVSTLLALVGPGSQAPLIAVEVRHLGGATARDVPEGSAVGGRTALHALTAVGAPDPSLFETVLPQFMGALREAVQPWTSAETTINFVGNPQNVEDYGRAWPAATAERLREVRRRWDPKGLFAFGPLAH